MTAKESFLAKLNQEKKFTEASGPEQHREWQQALEALFDNFRKWLRIPKTKGLLTVEEYEIQTESPSLGTTMMSPFLVPALKIVTPRGQAVHIVPKARMVVGAMGRVDFESGALKTMLVRKAPDQWQFARLGAGEGGWQLKELSEDSFFAVLDELLS